MRHKVNSLKPLQASTPIRAAAPADSAVGRHVASFRSQPVSKTGGRVVASCAMQLESSPSHEIYERLHCRPVETLDWPEDFHERYELCGELGHGSFGTVEAARDKLTGTEYAVKIIPKHATNAVVMGRRHAHRARQLTKLKQEVKFLQLFSVCPFAVHLVGAYQDDSYAYIVQEELYGGTLKEALTRRGRFAEEQAAEAMFCILNFLAECHSHNVHFGDVKLANFMFADVPGSGSSSDGGFGLLKGIDFGCSSECPDGVHMRTVMGTPLYAAPEQYRHSFDRRADMWAVGVILYQLLSGGAAPFWPSLKGLSMVDLMTGATQGRVRWPSEVWQNVSAEAKDLILQLLQRDPAQRLSAMAALRHPFIANRLLQHPEWLRWVQPTAPLLVSNVVPFHACSTPLEQQQPQQVHALGV